MTRLFSSTRRWIFLADDFGINAGEQRPEAQPDKHERIDQTSIARVDQPFSLKLSLLA